MMYIRCPILDTQLIHQIIQLLFFGTAVVWAGHVEAQQADQQGRPNIILMMADDMGFSDLGCYGSEIHTPNLDRLAENGVRFTQFYNTGRCCPSRSSLLTGLYPHTAGMGAMNYRPGNSPAYRGQLRDNAVTVAEHLSAAGYEAYMVGKWHQTWTSSIDAGPNGSWPTQRGFSHFYGTMEGAKDYFSPAWMMEDTTPVESFPEDYFYTIAISERAAGWIRGHEQGPPLFMYVAFYAPHFPLHAPEETVETYRERYAAGWDAIRQQRFDRQIESGLIDQSVVLSPRDTQVPEWDSLSASQREEMAYRMAIYAAQVDELDRGVGRILDALEATGRLDNTLILFISDNGGGGSGGPMGRGEARYLNRSGPYTTYGSGWANVSNTPYRLFKSNAHEGGVLAPLITHWPAKMDEVGGYCQQVCHIIDLTPTLLDVAECQPLAMINGERALEIEGRSIAPMLTGTTMEERPVFFEHQGNRGLRRGRWKLVARGADGPWELYDFDNDPTELNDLAERHPAVLERLTRMWMQWADDHGVRYNP